MTNKLVTEIKVNSKYLILLFAYTVVITFFCSKMSPFYPIQEWSDVNLYFNIGKAIANGQTLYAESFDHKGPLIFIFYTIGYLISNDSFLGVFFIQCLIWTGIVYTGYFCARLFLDQIYSFAVAAFFLLLFISHTSEGGSAEEFVSLFMATSLYLFVRYFRHPAKHQFSHMYIHGLMWGAVFLIKFNLIAFWIFPLLAIGLILLVQKEYKNISLNICAFILGGITIMIPFLIYFVSRGALSDAIDSYFILNGSFKMAEPAQIINKLIISFYQRFRFETIEFSIILLGAFIFPIIYLKNIFARIALPLSFLSLFCVIFMSGYIYYYSIPYYLFAILGLIVIGGVIMKYVTLRKEYIVIIIVLSITLLGGIYRKSFFGKYEKNNRVTVIDKFLPLIKESEDRTLLNLALDDANALFTYGNIIPNTKYFIAPNLPYQVYPQLRDEQARYIENKQTMFVVLAERTLNADYFKNFAPLKENYQIVDSLKEFYSWHNADRYYYLYKRK